MAALEDIHGEVLAVGIDCVAAGVEWVAVGVLGYVFCEYVRSCEGLPVLHECAAVFVGSFHGCVPFDLFGKLLGVALTCLVCLI